MATNPVRALYALPAAAQESNHAASKASAAIRDNACADYIVTLIHGLTLEVPGSVKREGASWFLLQSREFFVA
jgi:hypothetical protein